MLLMVMMATGAVAFEPTHEDVPGVVIHFSPAASGKYIGCPAITVLPGGEYVASHSFFGPEARHRTRASTLVFGSTDRGQTWSKRSRIDGQFWSTFFVHDGSLYIMGTDKQWGDVVIRRSRDGGRTWTDPADEHSGRLLDDARYHSSSVPVVVHEGRLWRAMEGEDTWPARGPGTPHPYGAFVMSAPWGADLLRAKSWTRSNYQRFDLSRVGKKPGDRSGGWREGNIVVTAGGQVINFLRIDDAGVDRADLLPVSADGRTIRIDDENWGLIDFPGGRTKFTIYFDAVTARYWSLVNKQSDPDAERNVLALVSSGDLKRWKVNTIVLRHRDRRHHAWQYVDWRFDGEDIVAASRTAWGDSHNFHDANYLTFHRIERFRELTGDDDALWLPPSRPVVTDAFIVRHSGLEVAALEEDVRAFGNRTYVWQRVPGELAGWRFLRTLGGEPVPITVEARRDATLRVATAPSQKGFHMEGWRPVERLSFIYTSPNRTPMVVFETSLRKGETIQVPQSTWTGGVVLIGPEPTR